MTHAAPTFAWLTTNAPGAVAVLHVAGSAAQLDALLSTLTSRAAPQPGSVAWRTFAGLDDGLLVRLSPTEAWLTPHAGPRLRTQLTAALCAAGAHPAADTPPAAAFPEARDALEAAALHALATAASPRAVDVLLAQPARWRAALASGQARTLAAAEAAASPLAHLLHPPRVVLVGPANAGKSTLLNALAGRAVAVAHDQPGTTRDVVAARLELDGLTVDWFDTPGVRAGAHAAETTATALAAPLLERAHLIVQLTAPGLGWHAPAAAHASAATHAPAPLLRILNKHDHPAAATCAERAHAALSISALHGDGLHALAQLVRQTLVPDAALHSTDPWCFSPHVQHAVHH
ncbi:MAG: GTPase [Phycisphaerales bacterium]